MQISARGIVATIAESVGKTEIKCNLFYLIINCSKVGTVFVYLLSNFRFDNNLLIVICRIFSHRTQLLVTLDSGSLYKGQSHGKMLGRNK